MTQGEQWSHGWRQLEKKNRKQTNDSKHKLRISVTVCTWKQTIKIHYSRDVCALCLLSHIRESSHGSQSALARGQEGHMAEWAVDCLEGNTQTLAAVKASNVNTHGIHTHLLSSQPFRFPCIRLCPLLAMILAQACRVPKNARKSNSCAAVSADAEGTSNNLVNSILTIQLNRHFSIRINMITDELLNLIIKVFL